MTPLPVHLQSLVDASRAALGPFAREGRVLATTTSTNDDALRWAAEGAPDGAWVVAAQQTAGRGRRGRVWLSPPGAGLYLSVVIRPRPAGDGDPAIGLLTVMAGVATVEAIADATGVRATLKWPNDVMIDAGTGAPSRKLAGILAEGALAGSRLSAVVVGIGVNLRPSAYPPEVAARAVALETLAGRPVDPDALLLAILAALHRRRSAFRAAADAPALLDAWRAWSPSAVGARIRWQELGRPREGITNGVDDMGALRVRTPAGEARLVAGDVEWA